MRLCARTVAALAATLFSAAASANDAAALLAAMGKDSARGERRAAFVERKTSALLNVPLESRGTLVFRAPDYLEKLTTAPQRERVRIQGGTLTLEGAPVRGQSTQRTVAVAEVPMLAPLIESLRATLAGDLPALLRYYEVALTRDGAKTWTLTLTPRETALREAIVRIVMRGADAQVRAVEIIEVSGDRTDLVITPLS
jgi:hypothetical protein